MRRIGERPLSKISPLTSSLVKPNRYRDLLLAELRKAPATASRLSTLLHLDRGETFHTLRRLERQGLAWSLKTYRPTRHGKPTPYRIYFIAGMADGLPASPHNQGSTLIQRAAYKAVEASRAVQERWSQAYRELRLRRKTPPTHTAPPSTQTTPPI
jgi:sugar-specific transcriptional regulator TrmB